MALLFILLVGLSLAFLVAAKFFFPRALTIGELSCLLGGSLILSLLLVWGMFAANVHDFDFLNGQVISKQMVRVPCRHSYQCMCVTISTGKDSTTTVCQTCYLHPYDQDWDIHTSVGNYTIDTKDSQGLDEPSFWAAAKPGDPVARKESVTNYLKASPQSLFSQKLKRQDATTWKGLLPDYPSIHHYYEINRVAVLGFAYPQQATLNSDLNHMLETLGPRKQVNVVVVLAKTPARSYKNTVERQWNGAKKNDVVVVIGTTNYPKIAWADAFSFAKSKNNELLMVKLRDQIEDLGTLTQPAALTKIIQTNVDRYYHRVPMSTFAYLRYDYRPSGLTVLLAFLGYFLVFWAGLIYCIRNNDTVD